MLQELTERRKSMEDIVERMHSCQIMTYYKDIPACFPHAHQCLLHTF